MRKRVPRLGVRVPVTLWQSEGDSRMSGHMLNVSSVGTYVATYEPLPTGTAVVIEVEFAGKTIRVSGEIVHDEDHVQAKEQTLFTAGMGIRFDSPGSPEVAELLKLGRPLSDGGGRRKRPR